MRHLIFTLLLGGVAFLCTSAAQDNGKLIIFLQHGRSMTEDFKRNVLPEIENYAQKENILLEVLDAREGAPEEVKLTPAIIYQNHNSRSIFRGRYRKVNQITAFIEKSKSAAQTEVSDYHESMPTWSIGRVTLAASISIQPIEGKITGAFDQEQFNREAFQSIIAGMEYFKLKKEPEITRHSKLFKMEFYPEKTKDGLLLVSMKLYSEFDQDHQVFETKIPSGGEWKEMDLVFRKAGNRLEKALIAQISNWDNGDGFDTLSDKTPVKSWQELGLGTVSSSKVSTK